MTQAEPRERSRRYPFDYIVIGYCLFMTVTVLILGRPLREYVDELMFYPAMIVIAFICIRYADASASRFQSFVRLLYPAAMITFFYRMTGGQMFLLFDGFFDWQVVEFERALLGINPTLYIDRNLLNVFANELLSLCYFAYYPLLPAFIIPVFVKRDYRILSEFLAAASLTFFASYVLFWLYPVEGPRWFFADQYINAVEGPIFRPMVEMVINAAAVRGGAMPSSHTGVAIVVTAFCFRYYRNWGWRLAPIVVGLAIGTVWGRFHYASDVVVGAAIAAVAIWIVWKYFPERTSIGQTRAAGVRVEESGYVS